MSRSINLRKSITNQIIDDMIYGNISSPIPSQTTLAELYNVSRTTIRAITNELISKDILSTVNGVILINRTPQNEDKYQLVKKDAQKNSKSIVESYLNYAINNKKINPGDTFSERQLAQDIGLSGREIHEQLIIFSRFKLITNIEHGIWSMNKIDQDYVAKLYELRIIIESHSLQKFMQLPPNDTRWSDAKLLLAQHKKFDKTMVHDYREFSKLDRLFHKLLLSASNNIFMEEYFETISLIFHLQYQWDDTDLRNRNQVAIAEHMSILGKILNGSYFEAKDELEIHLKTAKRSFENSMIVNS